jgi:exosporium-targeted protein
VLLAGPTLPPIQSFTYSPPVRNTVRLVAVPQLLAQRPTLVELLLRRQLATAASEEAGKECGERSEEAHDWVSKHKFRSPNL